MAAGENCVPRRSGFVDRSYAGQPRREFCSAKETFMPWFSKPLEYICDDCDKHFYNRAAAAALVDGGYASSPATLYGPGDSVTRCEACATARNRHFLSSIANQGTSLGTTISYKIHNGGNFSFLGGKTAMLSMAGATAPAMVASGALNLMAHPAYPGGMIRPPGAFSGPNLQHAALKAWPGLAGMAQHHVHVGAGGATRVLFGWTAKAYPAPNAAWVQAITLYIGS
jgi:hypothetical protein